MASGGKGGGKSDPSAMIAYGDKAMALQKEIYDTQRADSQPWYQAGTQAVGQLQKLMGLGGAGTPTSASPREQLIKQYSPQFTTKSGGGDGMYVGPDGRVYSGNKESIVSRYMELNPHGGDTYTSPAWSMNANDLETSGFKPFSPQISATDTAGLNAYVDNLIAQQQEQYSSDPEFGRLAKNFTMEDYQADPGYAFRLAEGNKALERKMNAAGKTFSPEAAKALAAYNQDMGSQEYANAYNRFNIDQDSIFNRLAALSGYGQTATGQIANAGSNYANAGSDILTSQGNAITAANQARGGSSMFQNLLAAVGTGAQAYTAFSDRRLKTNIEEIGEENGHTIYKFAYRDDPEKKYIGVMAQDVLKIDPMAVIMDHSGYYKVDYNKIGVTMREA